jgi:hypothetical protein
MNHDDALRLKATEKYLLNELDPEQLDQFEEHIFDCPECAIDVRAGAMFVEQSKALFSDSRESVRAKNVAPVRKGWFEWIRPAFAVPAMALLLLLVGYQNLVTYPKLHSALNAPQVLPWAMVNIGSMGNSTEVTAPAGKGFLLFVRIPPEGTFARYTADLYNPSGKLEWSLPIPVASGRDQTQDRWTIQVPAANRASGTYTLAVHGTTDTGEDKEIGRTSFDLKIQQ